MVAYHAVDLAALRARHRDHRTHRRDTRADARDAAHHAELDGVVARDHGTVDLALRVDLDDRPRQIYDPAHGKPAIIE